MIFIYKKEDLTTIDWQGGKTTQLVIYPFDAVYPERDFLFRISTATVEVEESAFTPLHGIKRELMILSGELKIEHKNRYTKILRQFETDSFFGDWETRGYGKVSDFNLMTRSDVSGKLFHSQIKEHETVSICVDTPFLGLYIYSGFLTIKNHESLGAGDFVLIEKDETENYLEINSNQSCEIILVKIGSII